MITLRPYQSASIDCLWAHLAARPDNPCIVMPTGAGKSPTMAAIVHRALTEFPGTRICVVAHVRELVAQNAEKLYRYWPDAPVGIYSASLGKRDTHTPILFASIQSVYNRAFELGRFDLILIDEAHRIPVAGEGMYRKFIDDCTKANPHLRIIGLTATPYRLGAGNVCGPEYMLNSICYEASVRDLIEQGYLCKLVSKGGLARANLADVHVRGGEYVAKELDAAVNTDSLVRKAVAEMVRLCADRHAWIVFCASVDHAERVSRILGEHDIEAPVIEGNTATQIRDMQIGRFQRGEVRVLCNVNVLSEGFDAPHVDAVILLRPTKSAGLYYQQVGRGLRLHPSKQNCLVLDFAGNISEHGPIDAIRAPHRAKKGPKADVPPPTKECPKCQEIVLVQVTTCPACEHVFPVNRMGSQHDATASTAPILTSEEPPIVCLVDAVTYHRHEKPGGLPSLRVEYDCGLSTYREWICLEHSGMPRVKACTWWATRAGPGSAIPRTVDDALSQVDQLMTPTAIQIRRNGKFTEVFGHQFEPMEQAA